jgi:hypothetical protein
MSSCKNTALCNLNKSHEKFWMEDYKELYKNNNYIKFLPQYEMTRNEQLNAATRFFVYLFILLLLFNKSENWLYIPIIGLMMVITLYSIKTNDSMSNNKELDKILSIRQKEDDEQHLINYNELRHDDDDGITLEEFKNIKNIEAGIIDSNGELHIGRELTAPKYRKNNNKSLYTVDELIAYQKDTSKKPTFNNPFMNPNINDYNNGVIPVASNVDDDNIKENIRVNFNTDLFRDVDELWEKKNSQRQFYTIPNTSVPNNQIEFAKWLYKIPETCKTDQQNCLRYDPLRYQIPI